MFRILHLSDLHIRAGNAWSTTPILADALRLIKEQANRENVDVVAFTGDIAFSGKADEYKLAADWLNALCLEPTGLNLDRKAVMFVPGNHDVDRALITAPARAIEEQLAKSAYQSDVAAHYGDQESLSILMRRLIAYSEFTAQFGGSELFGSLCWSRVFEHHGRRIQFDGLNSAWLCRGDDDHRRLLIGQPQLTELSERSDDCDFAVALIHHPLADLMEHDEENTRNFVKRRCDLLLRGHMHRACSVYTNYGDNQYIEVAGGALHERHESQNRFGIIDLSDDLTMAELRTFIWQDGRWISDRNLFQTVDGVGRFSLPTAAAPLAGANSDTTSGAKDIDAREPLAFPRGAQLFPDKDAPPSSLEGALAQFPTFTHQPSKQDAATRHTLLTDVLDAATSTRDVPIRRDPGTHYEDFLEPVMNF